MLDQVPTVKEHMQKFEVQMGIAIMHRRAELGLSQSDLVKLVNKDGDIVSSNMISLAESGEYTIASEVYGNILNVLGKNGYTITIKFD